MILIEFNVCQIVPIVLFWGGQMSRFLFHTLTVTRITASIPVESLGVEEPKEFSLTIRGLRHDFRLRRSFGAAATTGWIFVWDVDVILMEFDGNIHQIHGIHHQYDGNGV